MEGVSIIEQIGNVILRLETQKDNILANRNTLTRERVKSDDCISLLKMIIQMKAKEVVEAEIFPKGDKPLFKWLQSMQYKLEMILVVEKGLNEIEHKVKKVQDKGFKLMNC